MDLGEGTGIGDLEAESAVGEQCCDEEISLS